MVHFQLTSIGLYRKKKVISVGLHESQLYFLFLPKKRVSVFFFFNCLLVISLLQMGKPEAEEILLEAKADTLNGIHPSLERQSSREISSSDQLEHKSLHAPVLKKNDQIVNLSVGSDDSDRKHSMGDHSRQTSSIEGHEALNESSILELSTQNSGGKFVKESNNNNSTSILDKIFGSAIANLTDSVAPVMVNIMHAISFCYLNFQFFIPYVIL